MGAWQRRIRYAVLVLLVAVPLAILFTVLQNRRSHRVVQQWHQPDALHYASFDPYSLSVIEESRGGIVWWSSHRYYIFIGRGNAAPAYGHYLDHTFYPGHEDVEAYIKESVVEWSADGVTFVQADGHRLFIPKNSFIGGR